MRYLVPFSLQYLLQLSILSTTIALINIGINSLLGVEKKYNELVQLHNSANHGYRQLPPAIKAFGDINNKVCTRAFFWLYTFMVGIYFILILISNFIPDFVNIRHFLFKFDGGFDVELLLVNGNYLKITCLGEKIAIFSGVILSWIELLITISIYALFIYVMKKYINIIVTGNK
ncbi:hypothetical protein DFR58_103258 [Anaerobacterium chartisolvens]|uniref:Uncharacterized protein n=1 Tax=Anaerobacterium chartisolvens TaxID=1297424 RepID=A0A369BDN4_9FIRM|nr:hypothetical protein [Anaerobacterium chartisolvens]RCX19511.1 hypothetical protein DFR58_103258 [Anaerobacterium chartisolvens]